MVSRKSSAISILPQPASSADHPAWRRRTITSGYPAAGCITIRAITGGQDTGTRIGSTGSWMPAHYIWSPSGCIYVSGYWDYRVAYRGQLFTPAYFHHAVYARPGFCYRPSYVINTRIFFLHLFVCLQDRHYYYGDYHGDHHRHGKFCSHAYFHKLGYGYDPLFVYYRHHYRRHGIDYGHRLDEWHAYFDKHKDHRPPRTVPEQIEFAKRHRDHKQLDHLALARALDREVANPRRGRTLVPVAKGEKAVIAQRISELRDFSRKRGQLEGRTGRTIRRDIDRLRDRGKSPPLALKPPRTPHRSAGRDRLVPPDPSRGTSAAFSRRHVVGRGGTESEAPRRIVSGIARPSVPPTRVGHSNRSPGQLVPRSSLPTRPRPAAQPKTEIRTWNRPDRFNVRRTPTTRSAPHNITLRTGAQTRTPVARPQMQPRQLRRPSPTSVRPPRGGAGRKASPKANPSGRGKRKK